MNRSFIVLLVAAVPAVAFCQRGTRHGGGPVQADIHPLIQRLMDQKQKVRFSGVRVVQHIERGVRRLMTESVVRDGVRIRTEVLHDSEVKGQISVEDDHKRLVWSPATNEIREMPARESEAMFRLARIFAKGESKSEVKETDGGSIAGFPTRQLEVDNSKGGVVSRAWIDPAHNVLLKLQTFDPRGDLVGSIEFTSVQFNPTINASTFRIDKPGARLVTPYDDLKRLSAEMGFKPMQLPRGWTLLSVRKLEPKGVKVLMQLYGNQRSRVSFFMIQGPVNADRLKRIEGRNVNSYVWENNGMRFALLGDPSEQDLRQLASHITE